MQSTLSWIDHDNKSRERTLQVLALFQEKDSRDELGFGAIRDSFSDLFFPGTSTIQTRLRYMLIVPWMYKELERRKTTAEKFPSAADKLERDLIKPLLDSDDQSGVFGRTSGQELKRLPSSVYWAGLGMWGIRKSEQSRDQYMSRIDDVYQLERRSQLANKSAMKLGDDVDTVAEHPTSCWDLGLPSAPDGFPEKLDLEMTQDESRYIQERIMSSCSGNLFAYFAEKCEPVDCDVAWEHPDIADFSQEHQEQLDHARLFALSVRGAAYIYNRELSQLRNDEERAVLHREGLSQWVDSLPLDEIRGWNLTRLWQIVSSQGHSISPQARTFVEQWVNFLNKGPENILNNKEVNTLIQRREQGLKGSQSRYRNRRALEQWGGNSGTALMNYRWPIFKNYLIDLHKGLNA